MSGANYKVYRDKTICFSKELIDFVQNIKEVNAVRVITESDVRHKNNTLYI